MAGFTVEPASKISRFQPHADEANGSIQWKMTHEPRLCVKTADNWKISYWPLSEMGNVGQITIF